jgi:uncharacterized protein YrrD
VVLRSINELRGYAISAVDGDLGTVKDVYFDDRFWLIRYLVVSTGPWLVGRKVLLSPVSITDVAWDSNTISVRLTKEQVRRSPGIETDEPVSRQMERELVRYYEWPAYWAPHEGLPPGALPLTSVQKEDVPSLKTGTQTLQPKGDPHLYSVHDVTGYHIQATDDRIGHVDDFIVDDEFWAIRYMVVDTRNWLPGRMVLVAPSWISEVDWGDKLVRVDLASEAIRQSPQFDPNEPINREYELQLYDFYGRPTYWNDGKPT